MRTLSTNINIIRKESLFTPDIPSLEEISIAPGKEKNQESLISDEDCDALAFFIFFFYREVW